MAPKPFQQQPLTCSGRSVASSSERSRRLSFSSETRRYREPLLKACSAQVPPLMVVEGGDTTEPDQKLIVSHAASMPLRGWQRRRRSIPLVHKDLPVVGPAHPQSVRTLSLAPRTQHALQFLRSVVFGTTRAQAVGWLPQATDRRRNSVGLGVIGILQARKCRIGQD